MPITHDRLASLLLNDIPLRLVEPHIYSVLQDNRDTNVFDRMALFYDVVICNPVYNRLVWGYSVKDYETLTRDALTSSNEGWVLDCGCGSLAFTAGTYLQHQGRPIVLMDQALELLRLAKSRLIKHFGRVPANMIFLQADALDPPFFPGSFSTIISLNLLHILPDAREAVRGLKRILSDHGTMKFTTLVRSGRAADRYLALMLRKAGDIAPRSIEELRAVFDALPMRTTFTLHGSMAFISCVKSNP